MAIQFLSEGEILHELRRRVKESRKRILAAIAYWGYDATANIGLDRSRAKDLRLIANAYADGTNPKEILDLQKINRAKVRDLISLHSKIWIIDDVAIVGSANASSNAMGTTNAKSKLNEAVLVIDDSETVKKITLWFERMWDKSTLIDVDLLKRLSNRPRPKKPAQPAEFRRQTKIADITDVISARALKTLTELGLDVKWGPHWKDTSTDKISKRLGKRLKNIHGDEYWFTDSDWPVRKRRPSGCFISIGWDANHHQYEKAKAEKITPYPKPGKKLEIAASFLREIGRINLKENANKEDDICIFVERLPDISDVWIPQRIKLDGIFRDRVREKLGAYIKARKQSAPNDKFFWGGIEPLPQFLKRIGYVAIDRK